MYCRRVTSDGDMAGTYINSLEKNQLSLRIGIPTKNIDYWLARPALLGSWVVFMLNFSCSNETFCVLKPHQQTHTVAPHCGPHCHQLWVLLTQRLFVAQWDMRKKIRREMIEAGKTAKGKKRSLQDAQKAQASKAARPTPLALCGAHSECHRSTPGRAIA